MFGSRYSHVYAGRDNDHRSSDQRSDSRFYIDDKETESVLRNEAPGWPLSVFTGGGTTSDTPKNLIGSEFEHSPEEVRLMYYLAKLQGNEQAAQEEESQAVMRAIAQRQKVLSDLPGAIRFAVAGKREHPNRWDCIEQSNRDAPRNQNVFARVARPVESLESSSRTGFNQSSAYPQPSGFGRPSHFSGVGPSSLAQGSSFGQPSQLTAGPAFGSPSNPGQIGTFGKPSALGQNSTFGQTSTVAAGSTFGQPSAPGTGSSFANPAGSGAGFGFGQPSKTGFGSGFGQPSTMGVSNGLGQPPNLGSTFARPPSTGTHVPAFGNSPGTSPFTQALPGRNPTFGAPTAFGQPAALGQATNSSVFGQPTAAVTQNESPFARSNPFSTSPKPQNGTFGAPSAQSEQPMQQQPPFGAPSTGFGQESALPFARPDTQAQHQQQTNVFGRPPQLSMNTQTNGISEQNGSGFPPTATPQGTSGKDSDPPLDVYGGHVHLFEQKYSFVRAQGKFEDGLMPEWAPQHNWVVWGQQELRFQS